MSIMDRFHGLNTSHLNWQFEGLVTTETEEMENEDSTWM